MRTEKGHESRTVNTKKESPKEKHNSRRYWGMHSAANALRLFLLRKNPGLATRRNRRLRTGTAARTATDLLHEKPRDHPAGKIVRSDDPADIPSGLSVIPGTDFSSAQKAAGYIFRAQDQDGVNHAPDERGFFSQQNRQGIQKTAGSVNGKHPQRGGSLQGEIPPAEGMEGCKNDFQAPAQDAASDKGLKYFFHTCSMRGLAKIIRMAERTFCGSFSGKLLCGFLCT